MNTYLPDPDFARSAEILDERRLNRQRADVIAILKACQEQAPKEVKEHPAVTMWRGCEDTLIQYGVAMCLEWRARGNVDNLLPKILEFNGKFHDTTPPEWLGDKVFHTSHQSYLLRLVPSHYAQFFPEDLRDDLPTIWPRVENRVSEERQARLRSQAINRAHKAKVKADAAAQAARIAAIEAGLHPDTLERLESDDLKKYQNEIEPDQLGLLESAGIELAEKS